MKAEDRLSAVFGALADPTRRGILIRLADGDATVTQLAEPFSISLPAISRHLKVLEHAGLISRSRAGQWRSSTLQAAPLKEATDWMERYRIFWDVSFDRLDEHLRRVQLDRAAGKRTGRTGRPDGRPATGASDRGFSEPAAATSQTSRKEPGSESEGVRR
jgi:DNA-binding transcriptional ArsR family regulator